MNEKAPPALKIGNVTKESITVGWGQLPVSSIGLRLHWDFSMKNGTQQANMRDISFGKANYSVKGVPPSINVTLSYSTIDFLRHVGLRSPNATAVTPGEPE